MSYATPLNLLSRYDNRLIAESSADKDKVSLSSIPEILRKILLSESLTDYLVEQINSGNSAINRINVFLEDASGVIDTYLSSITDVPVTISTNLLVQICCIIAYYRLVLPSEDSSEYKIYLDAIQMLEKINSGTLQLSSDIITDDLVKYNSQPSYFRSARL